MAKNRRQRTYSLSAARGGCVPVRLRRPRVEIDRGLAWYAVHCRARAERQAQSDLERAGFSTYLPTQAFRIVKRGRLVEVERMPVSRYLFVGLPMPVPDFGAVEIALGWDPTAWLQVEPPRGYLLLTPGCPDQLPLRIGAAALQDHADACAENGLTGGATGRSPLLRYQDARIVSGPLTGFRMRIEDVLCDERVRGLVDMLGGKVVVEATADQLEAA